MSTHDGLKQFLIQKGGEVKDGRGRLYYVAYSGDTKPIPIQYGERIVKYRADIVWERNGKYFIIEIAFEEDWRSIAGEIVLASLLEKRCMGVLIVTLGRDEKEIKNLIDLISRKLMDMNESVTRNWYYYNLTEEDIEYMKKELVKTLKKYEWLW